MTPELLSPAGSPEAVIAAVQAGAGAVYLGYGTYNARRNAKNFSPEELAAAVSYCHLRGVKVYLTLNTLLSDRELPQAYASAQEAAQIGVDALIVQDMGLVRTLRRLAPDMELHGSTQMSVHNLDGALEARDLGMSRVVLARELGAQEIAYITAHAGIETEVFVHGALCVCHSGQCYFSAAVGGRSGNRGLCAQPCRLPYGFGKRADSHPLSLKDLALAGHLDELRQMGVASLKIEGRMKRPEYVSVVTRIYRAILDERRAPTDEELDTLQTAFSREGFTDGYFTHQLGKQMLGVHEDGKLSRDFYTAERARYENEDRRKISVELYAMIKRGEPCGVAAKDSAGHLARAYGPVPEEAVNRPLTEEAVRTQLEKTGGTPFSVSDTRVLLEEGLSLPLSALNALRREVLEELSMELGSAARKHAQFAPFYPGAQYENIRSAPEMSISVLRAAQVTDELLACRPASLFLPLDELLRVPELPKKARAYGTAVGVTLPRVCTDAAWTALERQLEEAVSYGVEDVMAGNIGYLPLCRRLKLRAHGDFGLNITNTQSVKQYKRMGFSSLTLSFELQFSQMRDIGKPLPCSALVYGRLPLMVTEQHIAPPQAATGGIVQLTDRKGMSFPVLPAPEQRSEIYNSQVMYLADKRADYARIGLSQYRLFFTTEQPQEVVRVTALYLGESGQAPASYTRGLYYRGVK